MAMTQTKGRRLWQFNVCSLCRKYLFGSDAKSNANELHLIAGCQWFPSPQAPEKYYKYLSDYLPLNRPFTGVKRRLSCEATQSESLSTQLALRPDAKSPMSGLLKIDRSASGYRHLGYKVGI